MNSSKAGDETVVKFIRKELLRELKKIEEEQSGLNYGLAAGRPHCRAIRAVDSLTHLVGDAVLSTAPRDFSTYKRLEFSSRHVAKSK